MLESTAERLGRRVFFNRVTFHRELLVFTSPLLFIRREMELSPKIPTCSYKFFPVQSTAKVVFLSAIPAEVLKL